MEIKTKIETGKLYLIVHILRIDLIEEKKYIV